MYGHFGYMVNFTSTSTKYRFVIPRIRNRPSPRLSRELSLLSGIKVVLSPSSLLPSGLSHLWSSMEIVPDHRRLINIRHWSTAVVGTREERRESSAFTKRGLASGDFESSSYKLQSYAMWSLRQASTPSWFQPIIDFNRAGWSQWLVKTSLE